MELKEKLEKRIEEVIVMRNEKIEELNAYVKKELFPYDLLLGELQHLLENKEENA